MTDDFAPAATSVDTVQVEADLAQAWVDVAGTRAERTALRLTSHTAFQRTIVDCVRGQGWGYTPISSALPTDDMPPNVACRTPPSYRWCRPRAWAWLRSTNRCTATNAPPPRRNRRTTRSSRSALRIAPPTDQPQHCHPGEDRRPVVLLRGARSGRLAARQRLRSGGRRPVRPCVPAVCRWSRAYCASRRPRGATRDRWRT